MRLYNFSSSVIAAVGLFFIAAHAAEAQGTSQSVSVECTTDATGLDGVRHDCNATPSVIRAPANFVFNQNTAKGGETSGNGDDHVCGLNFSDQIEVIPGTGITQPATTTAHARSPSGHASGRGWVNCTYTIELVKYK